MLYNLKRFTLFIFVSTMLFAFTWFAWLPGEVTASEPELMQVPTNPAFIEYFDQKEQGELKTLTGDGYSLGYIPPPVDLSHLLWEPLSDREISVLSLPSSYDLREEGRVTAVRNQNPYGSCWAFATYASLESYLMPKESFNFSENNLMRLHGFDLGSNSGGNELMSIAYLARWSGPVLEEDDPYPNDPPNENLLPAKLVQQVEFIPPSPALIKAAIMQYGAIYAHMYYEGDPYGVSLSLFDCGDETDLLKSSYYNNTHSAYYYDGSERANHAVAIVGWDDNYDRDKFSIVPPGDGAWIIKNSWGINVHDDGYFYLSYYDTHAGSNATAFNSAEPTEKYSNIYEYDPLGINLLAGYEGRNSAYGASIFSAEAGGEYLEAVSTYAIARNVDYQVRIYTGVNDSQPTSGELQLIQDGSLLNAGYYTIRLDEAVPLASGENFSVVIKYVYPFNEAYLPFEFAIQNYSSAATASPGESFYSHDGQTGMIVSTSTQR